MRRILGTKEAMTEFCLVGVLLFVMTSCQSETQSNDASTLERTSSPSVERHGCIRVKIECTSSA
jgi:hypothetical protein